MASASVAGLGLRGPCRWGPGWGEARVQRPDTWAGWPWGHRPAERRSLHSPSGSWVCHEGPGQWHPLDWAPLSLASVHPSGQWGLGRATWCFVDASGKASRALQGEAEGSACRGDSSGKPFLRWPSSCHLAGSLPSEALLCPTSSGVTACRLRGPGRIRLRLFYSGFAWGTGPGVRRLPRGLSGRRLTSGLAGGFSSPSPLSRRPGGAAHEQRARPNELTALVTRSRPHRVAQEGRVATAQAPLSSPRPRWGTRHTALGPSGTRSHKWTPRQRRACSPGPHGVGAELLLT